MLLGRTVLRRKQLPLIELVLPLLDQVNELIAQSQLTLTTCCLATSTNFPLIVSYDPSHKPFLLECLSDFFYRCVLSAQVEVQRIHRILIGHANLERRKIVLLNGIDEPKGSRVKDS